MLQLAIEGVTFGIVSCSLLQLLLHFDDKYGPTSKHVFEVLVLQMLSKSQLGSITDLRSD